MLAGFQRLHMEGANSFLRGSNDGVEQSRMAELEVREKKNKMMRPVIFFDKKCSANN